MRFLTVILLPVVSVALALGAIELALRLTHYEEGGRLRLTLTMEYDPVLGWRHVPGFSGAILTGDYRMTVRYNSRGWRDRERTPEPQHGLRRVVVLGDSFTEGLGVAQEERFSDC